MSNTIFKVGDTVYDEVYFPGDIGKVTANFKEVGDHSNSFPVRVKFSNGHCGYTEYGKCDLSSKHPTLSHTPYEVVYKGFSQKGGHTFKPFDRVLVTDPGWDEWKLGIFSHAVTYEDYTTKYFILGGTSWAYCILYEGNEHLFSGEKSPF